MTQVLSAAGCLLGLIGIVLAVFFYIKSRKFKRLSFSVRTFGILSDSTTKLPGFGASYEGNPIERLTAAKILLWNSRTDIIHSSDLTSEDPIRFQLPDESIVLAVSVSAVSSKTNKVSVLVVGDKDKEIEVTLDYLAPKEGCLLSVMHTAEDDAQFQASGTVKGVGTPNYHQSSEFGNKTPLIGLLGGLLFWGSISLIWLASFPWKLVVPSAFVFIFAFSFLCDIIANILSKKAGHELYEKFAGDLSPSEFTQPPA